MNEITISSGKINVPVNLLLYLYKDIKIQFCGIFFTENTQVQTKIDGILYEGYVYEVQEDKALIRIV